MITVSEVDIFLGKKLKMARLIREMTQHDLGSKLGITLQQVQKYERGYNRISASRLHEISEILSMNINYFYTGLRTETADVLAEDGVDFDIVSDTDALTAAKHFMNIKDPAARKILLNLIRVMVSIQSTDRV